MLVILLLGFTVVTQSSLPNPTRAQAFAERLSKKHLRVGLTHGTSSLPVYVAHERLFQEEGLSVEVVGLSGGMAVDQALASDSVDLTLSSLNNLLNVINAGHPVKGFYAGFYQADFAWFARREITGWAKLKGKSIAVSTYGDITDFLTRHVVRRHGLDPDKDVRLLQTMNLTNALHALKAGRVDAAVLRPPLTFMAEADQFRRLGTQATEVGEAWPKNALMAKSKLLDEHPATVTAFLRAHVRAIRLARADRNAAVGAIMRWLKYERAYADRAYAEVMPGFNERGALPAEWMPVFWEIAAAAGDVKEPWPESKFLDRRFIDTFDAWAPR